MKDYSEKISRLRDEVASAIGASIPLRSEKGGGEIKAAVSDSEIASRLPGMIDHTLLRPEAGAAEIESLCEEAMRYEFHSVCVYSPFIELCRKSLEGSDVKICTVAGFPSGAVLSDIKAMEAAESVSLGADEIDMVANISALKEGNLLSVFEDIAAVVEAVRPDTLLKVILETGYLTEDEKIKGCLLAMAAGADFVKSSTGFGPSGAAVEDIELMRAVVGPGFGVKAAGGIRDAAAALSLVKAGASRIGTSASINIASGLLRMRGANCTRRTR
jgi:deoxyribose-phosphate aldolase